MALARLFATRLQKNCKTSPFSARLEHSRIYKHLQSSENETTTNTIRKQESSPGFNENGYIRQFMHLGMLTDKNIAKKLQDFNNITKGDKEKQNHLLRDKFPPAIIVKPQDSILVTVDDTKNLLKLARVAKLRAKLEEIPDAQISYSEFVRICVEESYNKNQGMEFAKLLEERGNVIIMGNIVFLRPDQVAKSIEILIPHSIVLPNDPRKKEFEELHVIKLSIDKEARAMVQRELYFGLGYLSLQTLWFMWLTFWLIGWDVMEPMCFFLTSIHFALAYVFFLRTSTEPSFEGYFNRRFKTKQNKLMKRKNFDVKKYNKLCSLFGFPNLD
ncbi:hypothetical protein ACFE04_002652 [Oxalis oulophora]